VKKWKRYTLTTIKWLSLVAYLVVVLMFVTKRNRELVCKGIRVIVVDSSENSFVTSRDIKRLIDKKESSPIGKTMRSINTYEMENRISTMMSVRDVQIYKTANGVLSVKVKQRRPLVRIFNSDNQSYYIDDKGLVLPLSDRFAAHVLVVNGKIKEPFTVKANQDVMEWDTSEIKREPIIRKIFDFARFIADNDFWNAQITQVYVDDYDNVELIPRVGSQVILLGSFDNFEKKLDKLKMFYEKALPAEGWNKYKMINLKYSNQIICTKR
jgi:cell division protein FtsQ